MDGSSFIRLILLSAIWGGSFLFMRIAAPVLGPGYLVLGRVGIAALFLWILALIIKKNWNFLEHWRHFMVLGLINSGLPFFLFSVSSISLTASQVAILNSTAPAWGFLIGVVLGSEDFRLKRGLGLLLGVAGVGIMFMDELSDFSADKIIAIACGIMAPFCYGMSSNYAKKMKTIEPFSNAYGSMVGATLWVLPFLIFFPIRSEITDVVLISILGVSILCSGVAYLLFFKLIKDIGPASTLTVTFLVPIFGIFWGNLILDEKIGLHTVFGMIVILLGTSLVTGFKFRNLWKKNNI